MPRFNVKLPDGRWRVFSTVVEDYITEQLTFDELREYRRERCMRECDRDTDSLLTDMPYINVMSYEDAKKAIFEIGGE